MADAQYGEGRQINLHSSGTDLVEASALAVKSASGAIAVDGITVGSVNALRIAIMDGSGNQITSFGGGTQYVEDAALGAVGSATGTLLIGRASAAAPTAVSADADAVGAWLLRSGQQVVSIAAGTALIGGDATGGLHVQGAIAHDAVDSGSPVKIGGKANATTPTAVANGDRTDLWVTQEGAPVVAISSGTSLGSDGGNALAFRSHTGSAFAAFGNMNFNGTNWDRLRGDTNGVWVHGPTASDAALAVAPLTIGGRASNAAPTAMSADGDVVDARFTRTGALNVFMVDQSGAAASLGGGTQYAGDAAATSTPTGTISMGLANASAPTNVSANNDAVALWANQSGSLNVVLRDTSGTAVSPGAQYTEDADLGAVGTAQGTLIVGRAAASAPTSVSADADAAGFWVSRFGALNVILRDTSGAAASLGGGTQFAEDDALTGTSTGTAMIGKRVDSLATLTPAANDAVIARLSSRGALWTALDTGTFVTPGPSVATSAGLPTFSQNAIFDGSAWDRMSSLDRYLTASATPTTGITAVIEPDRRFTSQTLATAANSTQTWDTIGSDAVLIYCASTQTGTMTFEVSADGTNWIGAEIRDVALDLWLSGTSFSPTANKVYRVITNGWRSLRARVVTALNGTVALTATLAPRSTVLNAIDSGPAPHAIGYTPVNYTATYTSAQTSTAINSNAISSTQRLVITSIQIQSYGTTAGTCVVYFGTAAYSRGTSRTIFDGEWAPSATSKPGFAQTFGPNAPVGAADEELRITTTNAQSVTVNVWGYIVPA